MQKMKDGLKNLLVNDVPANNLPAPHLNWELVRRPFYFPTSAETAQKAPAINMAELSLNTKEYFKSLAVSLVLLSTLAYAAHAWTVSGAGGGGATVTHPQYNSVWKGPHGWIMCPKKQSSGQSI